MDNKSFSAIPSPFDKIFEHYQSFNTVQSSLFDELLHSNKSVVLSAPTGSGKTVAFELAIVRMLLDHQQSHATNVSQALYGTATTKAIYVAPIKALCAERFDDWKMRFAAVGVKCLLITGDSELDELARLYSADVIITTPEKWDSLTRHWHDCRDVISSVRLFLIDEVHLLNEDMRGPVLEAIVSRMRIIARDAMEKPLRFVVASATIPNVQDITRWIAGTGNGQIGTKNVFINELVTQLVYSDADRPVPLEKHVLGFNSCLRGFKFDMSLNYKLMGVLRKYSDYKATMIFCNSRKSAEMAAVALDKAIATHFALSDQQKANLTRLAQSLHDSKLRKLSAHGIAYHHAGMSLSDRNEIEDSFRQGNLMVLLCTNTLAMGVNLPARLVVIKSTDYYHLGKMMEYPESTLLQMIGRAGRPQYDTKGVAVILTHSRNVRKYETLMDGKIPIESHLHKHLAEHLNSEIALGTVNNLEVAMNWMRSTYFYVRSMQNPKHYGLEENRDKDIIENKLEKMCLVQIQELENTGLISRNPQNELDVQTTSYGKLMAKYYLCFETMKLFRQVRGNESFLKILELIVRCREFSEFTLRVNEKRLLNDLNDTPLRFPRAGRIKTREDKISCLLQAVFGNAPIASPTLAQESVKMIRIGGRIAKCLLEYMRLSEHQAQHQTFHLGRYKALVHTVTIAKCFHAKLWENSEYAAKQLQKIGAVYSAQLVCAGKTTLKSLGATDARTIEAILNKSCPFGDEILQNLHQTFPEYSLQLVRDSHSMLRVCVRQVNEAFVCRGTNAMLIVGDSENELLLFIEDLDSLLLEYGCFMKTIKLSNPDAEKIHAHVIHATLVGVDVHETLILNELSKESVITSKIKKCKKRKQQTGVATTRNKKAKPNLSLSAICDVTVDSLATNNRSRLLNLQSFEFSKAKITNNTNISQAEQPQHAQINKNNDEFTKLTNNAEREEAVEAFNTFANKSDYNSTFVQTKLTQYFTQKKYTTNNSASMSASTIQSKQRDLEFESLTEGPDNSNYGRKVAPKSPLRATTPDLHDISAFLETQGSRESHERTQRLESTQAHTILTLTNLQTTECDIPNGLKKNSVYLETQKSLGSHEKTQGFKIIESQKTSKTLNAHQQTSEFEDLRGMQFSSFLETQKSNELETNKKQIFLTNFNSQSTDCKALNDTHISAFLETEKSKASYEPTERTNECVVPYNFEISDAPLSHFEISKATQSKLVENGSVLVEPLDLTKNYELTSTPNQEDQGYVNSVSSLAIHEHFLNSENLDMAEPTLTISPTFLPKLINNNNTCGLDLSRNATANCNMSWCDDNAKDDMSMMSGTLTSKSSDSLKNSPKSVENFLLCYKVALAFARLKDDERTIINFKNVYKRIWHSNEAIDFITAKLNKSRISRVKKLVPERTAISRRNMRCNVIGKNINKQKECPLSLVSKPNKMKEIAKGVATASKPAQLQQTTCAPNLKNRIQPRNVNQSTKPETPATLRNPFRLQLLNDTNKHTKVNTINNKVMNLVLDMKCKTVDCSENIDPMECIDYEAIERELEFNETQNLPSMSFEEYCNFVLQSPME